MIITLIIVLSPLWGCALFAVLNGILMRTHSHEIFYGGDGVVPAGHPKWNRYSQARRNVYGRKV